MDNQIYLVKREELASLIHEAVRTVLTEFKNDTGKQIQNGCQYLRGNQALADYLSCSVGSVIKWKNQGIIPFTQKGRVILYDVQKVKHALETNRLLKRKV